MVADTVKLLCAGDGALVAEFGDEISERVNGRVLALADMIDSAGIAGVIETIPTFRSLMICYSPEVIRARKLMREVTRLCARMGAAPAAREGVLIDIPVVYDGPDLSDVASHAGLTEAEVIAIHSGATYRIYMLGFLPGFAYLGGLDRRIHSPRLEVPRQEIAAGSVGIGGEQTGIYPLPSPGGWRLIGRTPLKPYDPARANPFLYAAGDRIRFVPIGPDEYGEIAAHKDGGVTWRSI